MIHTTSDILPGTSVNDVLYEMLNTRSEIIVRPEFNVDECFRDTCRIVAQWLKDNPGEPICLLVDEFRFVKDAVDDQFFDWIVRCLPSKDVCVIVTCHGVTDVSTDLRRVADFWVLFQLTLEADLERVRERCGDEIALEVQKLQPYEYIVWNDSIRAWKKYTDRTKWFVNLNGEKIHVA